MVCFGIIILESSLKTPRGWSIAWNMGFCNWFFKGVKTHFMGFLSSFPTMCGWGSFVMLQTCIFVRLLWFEIMLNILYGWTWMKVATLNWMGGKWCQITKLLCFVRNWGCQKFSFLFSFLFLVLFFCFAGYCV